MNKWIEGPPTEPGTYWLTVSDLEGTRISVISRYKDGTLKIDMIGYSSGYPTSRITHHMPIIQPEPPIKPEPIKPPGLRPELKRIFDERWERNKEGYQFLADH